MGRVSSSFPVTMSAVKTAYGATGTRTLRAFLAGGSFANTHTAAANGWVPSSGTIKLSDLRDATNLNVTFAGSNTGFYMEAQDEAYNSGSAYASCTLTVGSTGILTLSANPDAGNTSFFPNTWLKREGSNCLTTTCALFDVKWMRVSGDVPVNNNTWLNCGTSRSFTIFASVSGGGTDSASSRGRLVFRRADTLVELANVYYQMTCLAQSFTGDIP